MPPDGHHPVIELPAWNLTGTTAVDKIGKRAGDFRKCLLAGFPRKDGIINGRSGRELKGDNGFFPSGRGMRRVGSFLIMLEPVFGNRGTSKTDGVNPLLNGVVLLLRDTNVNISLVVG
jgi:hypothetical protein